ncbi:MAG: 2-phospho-L-lactate transferase [Candidatus Hadarchaeales archaeon]
MITVLSGGTGTPKLLQGLVRVVEPADITVIVNTAEDLELSGLYISPDVDRVIYTLAGIINEDVWYGIKGDTFEEHERIIRSGGKEFLKIGDRDRAIKLRRTEMMKRGATLSKATDEIRKSLGVVSRVLPMTDERVKKVIFTDGGAMSFHEFWVVRKAANRVLGVKFEGIERARPAPGVLRAIEEGERVIIGPSNPVTSILPIISIKEIGEALRKEREKVVAVSPIIGNVPVSGPAGVLMKGLGYEVSAAGVAEIYRKVAGKIVVDRKDAGLSSRIEALGLKVVVADLLMGDLQARERLAAAILKSMNSFP